MIATYIKENKYFVAVVILLHLFFFLLACHYKRIYMGDSAEYIYEAMNIKNLSFFYSGNPAMPILPEFMTQRQPLYPLFLLLVYFVSINNWIVLVLQNVLSILNVLYARKLLQNIGLHKDYDWLFVLLVAIYPSQFFNANTIAPDILLQTCCLIYVGSFVKMIQTKQKRYSLYMGIALVGGMLVKPVLYPFVFVHIIILVSVSLYQKMNMQRLVVFAIIPLCTMLMYSYWNYTRTGKFHFSSNQAFNAVYYYYPYVSSHFSPDSANKFLAKERSVIAAIPEYKDRYDYANGQGAGLLKENLFPYLFFHLENSFRIFWEPGKAEMDLFIGKLTYGRLYSKQQTGFYASFKQKGWGGMMVYLFDNPSLPIILIVFLFNLLKLAGIYLFFRKGICPSLIKVFLFFFIAYFACAAGPIANTRYFLPVSLLYIGCATYGLSLFISVGNFSNKRNI